MSETTTPRERLPTAEEVFAERVAPLMELVERWPAVPLSGLDPDDPRRLAAEIAEELLRAGYSRSWGMSREAAYPR